METWFRTSLLLCGYGAIKEFRPSEPFITHYLVGPWKNFTEAQVNQEIYPVQTYARLVELVIVFLVTDILCYKPVIVFEGVAGIMTWVLLIWGENVISMQIMNTFFGLFIATEVAYYTYIYAQVDRDHYQKVTSHTRAAFLFGRFMTGTVSQILVSFGIMDYYQLNFITLASLIVATVWAMFLPPVTTSIYFHRMTDKRVKLENEDAAEEPLSKTKTPAEENGLQTVDNKTRAGHYRTAYSYLWKDFIAAFSNMYILKWSCWWAMATCGYVQVLIYVQLIWEKIIKNNDSDSHYKLYNGAVDSIYTILGALTSLASGYLQINWKMFGDPILAIACFLEAALLFGLTWTTSLPLAYLLFIAFGVVYNTVITVANAEVAKHISEDSCGLIFGINTFFSLAFQTILTAVIIVLLDLSIYSQFQIYGGYFTALGAAYACIAATQFWHPSCCSSSTNAQS